MRPGKALPERMACYATGYDQSHKTQLLQPGMCRLVFPCITVDRVSGRRERLAPSHNNAEGDSSRGQTLALLRIWIVGALEIAQPLRHYGVQPRALDSIEALYRELAIDACDVVLIDTALLGGDLPSTVQHLRRREDLGVVLLVGPDTPQHAAEGLWAGADVCLPHRPAPDLLAAKLFSLQRRLPGRQSPARVETAPGWALESGGWSLRTPGDTVLDLTEAERAFLSQLFAAPAETVSRERLIAALTDQPWNFDPHRIEVLVHRLRNRVRSGSGCTLPVRAVRGLGYRLTL